MRLTGKDLAATVFTGLVLAVYVAFRQGADLPLITSVRGTAAVVVFLGWVGGCALSSAGDVYTRTQRSPKMLITTLTVLGIVALASAVVALAAASETALTLLVVATVLLWLLSTLRHMFMHPVEPTPPPPARRTPVARPLTRV